MFARNPLHGSKRPAPPRRRRTSRRARAPTLSASRCSMRNKYATLVCRTGADARVIAGLRPGNSRDPEHGIRRPEPRIGSPRKGQGSSARCAHDRWGRRGVPRGGGKLTFFLGGSTDSFERVRSACEAMIQRRYHVGALRSAKVALPFAPIWIRPQAGCFWSMYCREVGVAPSELGRGVGRPPLRPWGRAATVEDITRASATSIQRAGRHPRP
jgi:hypothetical protein